MRDSNNTIFDDSSGNFFAGAIFIPVKINHTMSPDISQYQGIHISTKGV